MSTIEWTITAVFTSSSTVSSTKTSLRQSQAFRVRVTATLSASFNDAMTALGEAPSDGKRAIREAFSSAEGLLS